MKICFVNTFYYPDKVGGAEESVRILAENIVRFGHEAVVVASGERDGEEIIAGVKVYRVKIRNIYDVRYQGRAKIYFKILWHAIDAWNLPTAWKVGEILRKECPDLVNTNNLGGFSSAVWSIVKRLQLPLVHTIRDHYLLCPRATMFHRGDNCPRPCLLSTLYSAARRSLSAHIDAAVGISDFVLRRHLTNGFFPNVRSHVIFNAYERASMAPPTSSENDVFTVGYIGRLGQYKGVDLLLEEFQSLNDNSINLILAGVGEPSYEASIRRRFSSSRIRFEGFMAPDDFFRRIHVLVVPSLWHEPLGRVVFEAYSYGVPVIASLRGGIPEIVEHGRTGLLFEPSQPGSLAEAIRLFTDPAFRNPMREAALRKSEEFMPERIVSSYLNVFQGLTS